MALTDKKIRAAAPAAKQYQLVDADGLELLVTPAGTKVWRLRYRNQAGERRRITVGRYPVIGIAAAREKAGKLRAQVWTGEDPAADRAAKRVESETLADVVDQYVVDHRPVWKESTARTYVSALKAFVAWAERAKIRRVADLTPRALAKYRAHAVAQPRRAKEKGGSRRDVASTGERRSASAINCELRAVKTMLQTLRKARQLLSIASSDDITDALALVKVDAEIVDPLRPAELRKLLTACNAHDAATWTLTRVEASGKAPAGTTPKHAQIGPLVTVMLLSGMRLGEALALRWDDVDLAEQTIRVRPGKTHRERVVDLTVSPALVRLLGAMQSVGDSPFVFPSHTQASALAARLRLIEEYGAPAYLWSTRNSRPGERSAPTLRSTCGCYLTCAPSIFGAASVYRSAAQLGHSVEVAQRHYLGALRRISDKARTVESAMTVEREVKALITMIPARLGAQPATP